MGLRKSGFRLFLTHSVLATSYHSSSSSAMFFPYLMVSLRFIVAALRSSRVYLPLNLSSVFYDFSETTQIGSDFEKMSISTRFLPEINILIGWQRLERDRSFDGSFKRPNTSCMRFIYAVAEAVVVSIIKYLLLLYSCNALLRYSR